METKNTSRGSRNSSFGKGGGFSTSHNVPTDFQSSSSSPKPKVVHSPANRPIPQQIPRPQSSSSLSSSSLFQDIQIVIKNLTSQPQANITGSEGIAFNPAMNTAYDQFSNPGNGAPLVPNTNNDATSLSSFDSLIALIQQTMRNTQEEFRKELTSIRASITSSNMNRPPELLPNFTDSNISSFNMNRTTDDQSSFFGNGESNIKLEKWKISYDGSGSVFDFLFKVETLYGRSRCSDEHLLSNFHVLLDNWSLTNNWSPTNNNWPPTNKTWSPTNNNWSPNNNNWSPTNNNWPPTNKTWSPTNNNWSPNNNNWSPTNNNFSPYNNNWSPNNNNWSPTDNNWPPTNKNWSPTNNWSPNNNNWSPTYNNWSPYNNNWSPTNNDWSPYNKNWSPNNK
ncbi:uncharacterized protein DDB_G0292186-like [Lucilia cuprina]|uniref:uncharacterized protein DDB_G0292186-like n=1 Tax=Lucilia cuprina TaxID=7375 RepID=UPI001F05B0DA|nr:uncharacterized protein DDB_G0292186-like [Lucilia cuprina]